MWLFSIVRKHKKRRNFFDFFFTHLKKTHHDTNMHLRFENENEILLILLFRHIFKDLNMRNTRWLIFMLKTSDFLEIDTKSWFNKKKIIFNKISCWINIVDILDHILWCHIILWYSRIYDGVLFIINNNQCDLKSQKKKSLHTKECDKQNNCFFLRCSCRKKKCFLLLASRIKINRYLKSNKKLDCNQLI